MKKIHLYLFLLFSSFGFSQVGIGTASPNANSILELSATNKALLLPRVANTAAVYGAFLKQYKPSSLKKLVLIPIHINRSIDGNNIVYNGDINSDVIKKENLNV